MVILGLAYHWVYQIKPFHSVHAPFSLRQRVGRCQMLGSRICTSYSLTSLQNSSSSPVKNQALDACMAAARRYQNRSRARHRFASRQPQVSSQRIQRVTAPRRLAGKQELHLDPKPLWLEAETISPSIFVPSSQVPKPLQCHYYLTCFRTSQVWMLAP